MKKVVLLSICAVLIMGFASTATAKMISKFEFNGKSYFTYYNLSNIGATNLPNDDPERANFFYMKHYLNIRAYMSRTLFIDSRLRFLDKKWGRQQYDDHTHDSA
jgi:hypothetical protein